MSDNKLKELIQWLEINIKGLKKESANSIYTKGVKIGMIKNGELILNKAKDLLNELEGEEKW